MGGGAFGDNLDFMPSRNVVLVGRRGNGKSASGNTILGREAFVSRFSSAGVTNTCELQSCILEDGQILNVIDTPGLFSAEAEFVGKEILECINMAKDGVHAVLLVLSVRSRFSREELAVVESLRKLFGSKISNFMILVFTGGDHLDENDATLDDYLGPDCPEPLKEILRICGNRYVLFDNKTKNEFKKSEQITKLVALVNAVVENNGGKPYTDHVFVEQIESKPREIIDSLEEQLAEQRSARLRAEDMARDMQRESTRVLCIAREEVERARKENTERLCSIL